MSSYGFKSYSVQLLSLLALSSLGAQPLMADLPMISAVTQTGEQLTIMGSNFGTAKPTVSLNNLPASVMSYTDTLVVVTVPTSMQSVGGPMCLR